MSEELLAQIRPGMDLCSSDYKKWGGTSRPSTYQPRSWLNRRDSSRLTCRPDGVLSGRAASAPD
jgi:hypothetical protein